MKKSRCIDAGRQGCPCALAECGQCLICAKLRGGTCQECSWQGTCIYSLYEQNGRSVILSRKDRLTADSAKRHRQQERTCLCGPRMRQNGMMRQSLF